VNSILAFSFSARATRPNSIEIALRGAPGKEKTRDKTLDCSSSIPNSAAILHNPGTSFDEIEATAHGRSTPAWTKP
jgi:hypothetical protein